MGKDYSGAQAALSAVIADHLNLEAGCETYLACIQAFEQGFAQDTPMQLSGFYTLQATVFNTLLPALVQQGLLAAAPIVEHIKQRVLMTCTMMTPRKALRSYAKAFKAA